MYSHFHGVLGWVDRGCGPTRRMRRISLNPQTRVRLRATLEPPDSFST